MFMAEIEKINNDFVNLFREGRPLLENGCGKAMNVCREEAFPAF